jgi:PPOX class probable FMN-dependent enzyme
MPPHRLTAATIDSEAALRELLGDALPTTRAKIIDHLTPHTRRFVELSPFACIATSDARGTCDVSPRGDPPGFVRILDDRTLLVPDRPGNRLADSLRNIVANPRVGILFVIPGIGETFRVNGRAVLTTDATLLAPSSVSGKPPRLGILVDIEEAYTQCPKAFLRSQLWDPARFVDRGALPTSGEILEGILGDDFDGDEYDRARDERYARGEGMY